MGDTSIEWCDKTWNPVRGCSRVSPGCEHCYAETMAARFIDEGMPYEGLATRVHRLRTDTRGHQRGVTEGRWTGVVRPIYDHLADPLRWKTPQRIFVNSMSDLFHKEVLPEYIAAVFGVMAACPQHTFIVLTKRAQEMHDWFKKTNDVDIQRVTCTALDKAGFERGCGSAFDVEEWPLPNVWLGVSAENQEYLDARVPLLCETPAARRIVSIEPILGPVDVSTYLDVAGSPCGETWPTLDWVIAGCESGPGARPAEVGWFRALRDQCGQYQVPFFLKQAKHTPGDFIPVDALGRKTSATLAMGAASGSRSKKGVISLPYLDGVQHAAFPER
jgi:protein gp37